ncbi:hypothetical protein CFP56_002541 [Quercus suber]|uniref:Uncharacterized protein n=1 Tax=Quercus suber TaxID=58331 RepID=A0AAW0LH63_QUESU
MDEVVKEIENIMKLSGMNLSADSEPTTANYYEASKSSSHHPSSNDKFKTKLVNTPTIIIYQNCMPSISACGTFANRFKCPICLFQHVLCIFGYADDC